MMNPTSFDELKLTLSAREFKKRFCKVYENVILNYFTFSEDLISGAKVILNSKKEKKKFKTDFRNYQLAFLLLFGVQDTCTVARKFYDSIKNSTEVIKKLFENNPIKLLCIESESLPAVIGICQVINEIVKQFGLVDKLDFRDIRILIIDNRREWIRLCEFIIDTVNSYFTNIELKLYFVEDFINESSEEFIDIFKELDLMVVARYFAQDRCFTKNYNLMKVVLNEMKEDAVLFYFDSCNERYYANLKHLISQTSFYEVKSCESLHVLFEDLVDEEFHLDLPLSWDTDVQTVMFSTWIKAAGQRTSYLEAVKRIVSNQSNTAKTTEKSDNKETINGHIYHINSAKTSTSVQSSVVDVKKKAKSSTRDCNKSDVSTEQMNVVKKKKKAKSSKTLCNQSDTPSKQTSAVSRKQNKSAMKHCSADNATPRASKTGESKLKNKPRTQKTHEIIGNLLSILNKETTHSKETKLSQKSECTNVSLNPAVSKKVIGQAKNQINSAKEVGCEGSISSAIQSVQPKRKTKKAISEISTSPTGKMISSNQEIKAVGPRHGNVSSSELKKSISQKKTDVKFSKQKTKSNTSSQSTTSKDEHKKKSNNKKSSTTATAEVQSDTAFLVNLKKRSSAKNATLTKKSTKNNATEKVKLTGKFARMDLEKKNKDERHKMKAKKASFAKHANFDYDD